MLINILHSLLATDDEGAGSPNLFPTENLWHTVKHKTRQQRPCTVVHFKTRLQEELGKITPKTLHHLVSSVPKSLKVLRKGMTILQSYKCFTKPTFF